MEEAEHLQCKSKLVTTQRLRCAITAMRAKNVGDTRTRMTMNKLQLQTVDFSWEWDVVKTSVLY